MPEMNLLQGWTRICDAADIEFRTEKPGPQPPHDDIAEGVAHFMARNAHKTWPHLLDGPPLVGPAPRYERLERWRKPVQSLHTDAAEEDEAGGAPLRSAQAL